MQRARTHAPSDHEDQQMQPERLIIKQTSTGYWTVLRGRVHIAGAMTRRGAEAERDLLTRLGRRSVRRAGQRPRAKA
jgi:hypothetical protein